MRGLASRGSVIAANAAGEKPPRYGKDGRLLGGGEAWLARFPQRAGAELVTQAALA